MRRSSQVRPRTTPMPCVLPVHEPTHRDVAGPAEAHGPGRRAAGEPGAQQPAAGAEHAEVVVAVAVPVADDRHVAGLVP